MILVDLEEAESILNNDRSMTIDLSEHDAKVRADERAKVIDEIKDLIEHKMPLECGRYVDGADLIEELEQIKEKK